MSIESGFSGMVAIGLALFLAGWLVAGRNWRRELAEAYQGAQRAQRAADLARLGQLRRTLEADDEGGGILTADACLLYDVCQALRLTEGETQHVVGPAYWLVLDAPFGGAEPVGESPSLMQHVLMVCRGCGKLAPADELQALGGQCQTCSFGWLPGDDCEGNGR